MLVFQQAPLGLRLDDSGRGQCRHKLVEQPDRPQHNVHLAATGDLGDIGKLENSEPTHICFGEPQ